MENSSSVYFPDSPLRFRDAGMRGSSRILALEKYFRYCNPAWPIITVPTGFNTDGASIPRVFHNIIGPFGRYFPAAVIHDYLYSRACLSYHRGINRKMSDQIFLQAMKDCGVGAVTRSAIYAAVRSFGWRSFRNERS